MNPHSKSIDTANCVMIHVLTFITGMILGISAVQSTSHNPENVVLSAP